MGIFDKKDDKPPQSRPDFSNVRSGGSSTAPAAPQPTSTIGSGKTYVVVEGDSLSKIAETGVRGCQQVADDLRGQQRPHQRSGSDLSGTEAEGPGRVSSHISGGEKAMHTQTVWNLDSRPDARCRSERSVHEEQRKSWRDRHHRNRCRRPRFPHRHGSFADRRQDDQRRHRFIQAKRYYLRVDRNRRRSTHGDAEGPLDLPGWTGRSRLHPDDRADR